jgi:hypothetical protein
MRQIALVLDTTPFPAFQQKLKDAGRDVRGNPDYGALQDALQPMFPDATFEPKLAFVAVNFDNAPQKKFVSYLQHQLKFIVDQTDFRDAFVLPDRQSDYQRLSTRIAYVAGMLSQKKPNLLVVTDAFDVYFPLLDLAQNRGGTVQIAFFKSAMESRWDRVGLFQRDSLIEFIDLDPFAKTIIGVDLGSSQGLSGPRSGLGSLRI